MAGPCSFLRRFLSLPACKGRPHSSACSSSPKSSNPAAQLLQISPPLLFSASEGSCDSIDPTRLTSKDNRFILKSAASNLFPLQPSSPLAIFQTIFTDTRDCRETWRRRRRQVGGGVSACLRGGQRGPEREKHKWHLGKPALDATTRVEVHHLPARRPGPVTSLFGT